MSELQFERADLDATTPAGVTCRGCARPIDTHYFDVSGHALCPSCRAALARERTGLHPARFAKAFGLGLGAAALGSALYYAVSALTGYEFGLIGIVVGYAVGKAVRSGSRARGGWVYQTLAIVLTYLAIVSTYVPPLVKAIAERRETEARSAPLGSSWSTPPASDASAPAPAAEPAEPAPLSAGAFALALLSFAGIVLALPFLAGFENVMGIAIIAFSLYEAWKLNRVPEPVVSGPYDARTRAQLEEQAVA